MPISDILVFFVAGAFGVLFVVAIISFLVYKSKKPEIPSTSSRNTASEQPARDFIHQYDSRSSFVQSVETRPTMQDDYSPEVESENSPLPDPGMYQQKPQMPRYQVLNDIDESSPVKKVLYKVDQ